MKKKEDPFFFHYRENLLERGVDRTLNDPPLKFTVAGKFSENRLDLGIALCSVNDPFCKRTGRIKAAGRLKAKEGSKGKYSVTVINTDGASPGHLFVNFVKNVLCKMKPKELANRFNMSLP